MTPQELQQRLREVEGFVDMELKFGCEVICTLREYTSSSEDMNVIFCGKSSTKNTNITLNPQDKNDFRYFNNIKEVLGTPPSMQRVTMYIANRNNTEGKNFYWKDHFENLWTLWMLIDPEGAMNFFELIDNAGEQYDELLKFCKDYIF